MLPRGARKAAHVAKADLEQRRRAELRRGHRRGTVGRGETEGLEFLLFERKSARGLRHDLGNSRLDIRPRNLLEELKDRCSQWRLYSRQSTAKILFVKKVHSTQHAAEGHESTVLQDVMEARREGRDR
jgi:hypothetical protein